MFHIFTPFFDVAIQQYSSLNFYLAADAQIVYSPALESGIVKVLDDEVEQLTEEERNSAACFWRDTENIGVAMDSLVEKALQNKEERFLMVNTHY